MDLVPGPGDNDARPRLAADPPPHHHLCMGNYLLITRCTRTNPLCVAVSMNNLVQIPHAVNNQSIYTLGIHGGDEENAMEWWLNEMASQSLPDIANAAAIFEKCGIMKLTNGNLFTTLGTDKRDAFVRGTTDSFILMGTVIGEDNDPVTHFDSVINKDGTYYLLIGVSGAKVICLGEISEVAQHLFNAHAKLVLEEAINSQYSNSNPNYYRLGGPQDHLILLPTLNLPSGCGRSLYDGLGDIADITNVLKSKDVIVRTDNKVTKAEKLAVQIIDLNDRNQCNNNIVYFSKVKAGFKRGRTD